MLYYTIHLDGEDSDIEAMVGVGPVSRFSTK